MHNWVITGGHPVDGALVHSLWPISGIFCFMLWAFVCHKIGSRCHLLLSWNNILDNQISRKKIFQKIFNLFIYLQNMESNPWYQQYKTLILKNQLIMKACIFFVFKCCKWLSTSTTFLMMVLKLCMLLKKNKIYHFYVLCVLIHNFLYIYIENFRKTLQYNNTFHEQLIIQDNENGTPW